MTKLSLFLIILLCIVYCANSGNVIDQEIFQVNCLDPDLFEMRNNQRPHIRLAGFIEQSLEVDGEIYHFLCLINLFTFLFYFWKVNAEKFGWKMQVMKNANYTKVPQDII